MKRFEIWLILLVLSLGACFAPPLKFTPQDVKLRCLPYFKGLRDTSQIGVKKVSQDKETHWYIAYNKGLDSCRLFFYHIEQPRELPIELDFPAHAPGQIGRILYEDLTYDGENELIVELHFDYGLTYQGRQLLIYQHPFSLEAKGRKELFNFATRRIWGQIDSFDQDFGFPHESFRKEHDVQISFTGDIIRIRGTLDERPNRLLEYQWNERAGQFRLISEEETREAQDENKHGRVRLSKGRKRLVRITSHQSGCRAHILEDEAGHVLEVSERIAQALTCSPVASLSPDGRYLFFVDKAHNVVDVLDLDTGKEYSVLDAYRAHEGLSQPIWLPSRQALVFVAIDQEGYRHNTQVVLVNLPKEGGGSPRIRRHDLEISYVCDVHTGFCSPELGYDFEVVASGQLRFRPTSKQKEGEKPVFETFPLFD